MQRIIIPIIALSVATGCTRIPLDTQLPDAVTAPEEIPAIDAELWQTPESWPTSIQKGKLKYHVTYAVYGTNSSRDTYNAFSEVPDFRSRLVARYQPDHGQKPSALDLMFGPSFGWRPDGSLYVMDFVDENLNMEHYWIYPNGTIAQATVYVRKYDLWERRCYAIDGSLLGSWRDLGHNRRFQRDQTRFTWGGEEVTENEFKEFFCPWRKNLSTSMEVGEHNKSVDPISGS